MRAASGNKAVNKRGQTAGGSWELVGVRAPEARPGALLSRPEPGAGGAEQQLIIKS